MMTAPLRILLVDDHEIVRDGLKLLLGRTEHVVVVAEAADGRTAVSEASRVGPDIAIVDLHMPELAGLELIRRLREVAPQVKIVVLTVDGDDHVVREAMRLGVNGYVLKSNASAEVLAAVDTVARGQTYLSPEVTTTVADIYRRSLGKTPKTLTARETEVLRLLAAGQSSKEMAAALGLSVTTVDSHRHNIMKRLNLSSVADLTKYAIREGLASLDD